MTTCAICSLFGKTFEGDLQVNEIPGNLCKRCAMTAKYFYRRAWGKMPVPQGVGVGIDRRYHLHDIFYSIQGEGTWTGRPAVFIRLSGCNLNCHFCDTDHSRTAIVNALTLAYMVKIDLKDKGIDLKEGPYYKPMIVWTGGEPLLQLKAGDPAFIIFRLLKFYQAVETNGTMPNEIPFDWVTVSPKKGWSYGERLLKADEIKIVFDPTHDPHEMLPFFKDPRIPKFLQPMAGRENSVEETLNYVKEHPEWHLSVQTQKYLNIG